jgi:hypothetical protein
VLLQKHPQCRVLQPATFQAKVGAEAAQYSDANLTACGICCSWLCRICVENYANTVNPAWVCFPAPQLQLWELNGPAGPHALRCAASCFLQQCTLLSAACAASPASAVEVRRRLSNRRVPQISTFTIEEDGTVAKPVLEKHWSRSSWFGNLPGEAQLGLLPHSQLQSAVCIMQRIKSLRDLHV